MRRIDLLISLENKSKCVYIMLRSDKCYIIYTCYRQMSQSRTVPERNISYTLIK